jgi:hypothetical protein
MMHRTLPQQGIKEFSIDHMLDHKVDHVLDYISNRLHPWYQWCKHALQRALSLQCMLRKKCIMLDPATDPHPLAQPLTYAAWQNWI